MPEELQDAIEESLPSDENLESSPEVDSELDQEVSSEATEPQAETKEPPFNEHPRWKEVQEEKRVAQERADRLEQQLMDISNKLATPKEPGKDPYDGMNEEMREWAKFIDNRAEAIADKRAEKERKLYREEQTQTKQQLAMIAYKEFQTRHPDVQPNSSEENAIAKRVSMGYSPDDAYEIIVGSTKRKALEEELAKTRRVKAKNTQKLAANLETGGVASGSPIQPKDNMTVRDFVEHQLKQAS